MENILITAGEQHVPLQKLFDQSGIHNWKFYTHSKEKQTAWLRNNVERTQQCSSIFASFLIKLFLGNGWKIFFSIILFCILSSKHALKNCRGVPQFNTFLIILFCECKLRKFEHKYSGIVGATTEFYLKLSQKTKAVKSSRSYLVVKGGVSSF